MKVMSVRPNTGLLLVYGANYVSSCRRSDKHHLHSYLTLIFGLVVLHLSGKITTSILLYIYISHLPERRSSRTDLYMGMTIFLVVRPFYGSVVRGTHNVPRVRYPYYPIILVFPRLPRPLRMVIKIKKLYRILI